MNTKKPIITLLVVVVAAITILLFTSEPTPTALPSSKDSTSLSVKNTALESAKLADYPGSVAWIRFNGTTIDNPVMQAKNNDYYLRRDEAGKDSVWGCYYLDYECTPDSKNLIVYGHSVGDSVDTERFSQLKKLNEPTFAKENQIIELQIGEEVRQYQIVSAGIANTLTDTIAISANPSGDEMQQIVTMTINRSVVDFKGAIGPSDRLLTLSTCTSNDTARYLVVAKEIS